MSSHDTPQIHEHAIDIPLAKVTLKGDLAVPAGATGIVIFAHGSGSSRLSPRNRQVAKLLEQANLGTLLFDLLTPEEEAEEQHTRHLRFDICLLTRRLVCTTNWLGKQESFAQMKVGYFGASTGGGAAIVAAAELGQRISAVVSRGGRPDLAGDALPLNAVPTLLIVGGNDVQVIALNREALGKMKPGVATMQIVPGATHLFDEPGTLDQAAELARDWFVRYLLDSSRASAAANH